MLFSGALGFLAIAVWLYCIVDAVTTPADQVRNLPKIAWLFVVVLLFEIGAVAWLVAGRPWGAKAATPGRAAGGGGGGLFGAGTSATPVRRAQTRPLSPDDDDEFLASLSRRNEQQRKDDDGSEPT